MVDAPRERGPRERMVRSAAQLIRRQGVSGTGVRDVVAHAEAPRGSVQHYFPGGKDQLVAEALRFMGGVAGRRAQQALASARGRPSALLAAMIAGWKADLQAEGFEAGCPLVAAAADVVADSDPLRQVLGDAFGDWQRPLAAGLIDTGVPAARAGTLAVLVISALEGAIVLARVRHDVEPLDVVGTELGPVLDAAVERGSGRGRR